MTQASDSPTVVAEIQLPEGARAPFVARRVVRAIIIEAPASRSVDAALLVSEVVTLTYEKEISQTVRVEEIGRRARVTVTSGNAAIAPPDEMVSRLA